MKKDLIIEEISEANFDAFLYLVEQLARYEKIEPPDTQAKNRLKIDGLGANPKYEGYLALLDNEPVGYLTYFMNYSTFLALPTLYIEDIFILEEHRRSGFGQQILNFCIEIAKKRGCGRIEWCVLTWNKPAIQFYEKNGAKRLGWYFYRLTKDDFPRFEG